MPGKLPPVEAPDAQDNSDPRVFEARIASEKIVMLGHEKAGDKLTPRMAALFRRFGIFVDPAEVDGDDTNLLHKEDADYLRENCGYEVDPAEVEPGEKIDQL